MPPKAFFGVLLLVMLSVVLGGVAWWRFGEEAAGVGAVQAPVAMFVIVLLPWIAVYAHARAWDEEAERERPVLRRAWVGGVLASRADRRIRRARLLLEQTVYSGEYRAPALSVVSYPAEVPSGAESARRQWRWGDVLDGGPAARISVDAEVAGTAPACCNGSVAADDHPEDTLCIS